MRCCSPLAIVALMCAMSTAACSQPSGGPAASVSAQAGSVRHATPDAAAQAFLRALGTGDARGACQSMAAGGHVVETQQQAMEMCVAVMTQNADAAVSAIGPGLTTATVTGATTSGERADFASAIVQPQEAGSMIRSMKGIRIGGGWYITGE